MNDRLKKTLNNSNTFLTYRLGLEMLIKSTIVITKRGACSKAISFINQGIEMLAEQLDKAADEIERRETVDDILKRLRDKEDK